MKKEMKWLKRVAAFVLSAFLLMGSVMTASAEGLAKKDDGELCAAETYFRVKTSLRRAARRNFLLCSGLRLKTGACGHPFRKRKRSAVRSRL